MATLLKKAKQLVSQTPSWIGPDVVRTTYSSDAVLIPDDFLAPLPDPSVLKTERIDFADTPLPEYQHCYAVVLDNVLSQDECGELLRMAELSAGAHNGVKDIPNDGWRPAMVNAGVGHEFLALDYRNSDRIIWDNETIVARLWTRVLQGKGIQEYLSVLEDEDYSAVLGDWAAERGERWIITKQGLNERMRFLKYGAGQFFRPHCDGTYATPDGSKRSFYTLHLYLNDSAQVLEEDGGDSSLAHVKGGATTFHSRDMKRRLDVDPKFGRVLLFQHRGLLHSGDDVVAGIKYTMRSDLMFEFEGGRDGKADSDSG